MESESYNCKGYSPVLTYQVKDLESKAKKLEGYGAVRDGEAQEDDFSVVLAMRAPAGEMIGLVQ